MRLRFGNLKLGTWKCKARCRHTEVGVWILDIWNRSVHRVWEHHVWDVDLGTWKTTWKGSRTRTTMLSASCLAANNENTQLQERLCDLLSIEILERRLQVFLEKI